MALVPDAAERLEQMIAAGAASEQAKADDLAARKQAAAQRGVTPGAERIKALRRTPEFKKKEADTKRAIYVAEQRLVANHPDEFAILHHEERTKLGLPPLRPRVRRVNRRNRAAGAPVTAPTATGGVVGADVRPDAAQATVAAPTPVPAETPAPAIVRHPHPAEMQAKCVHSAYPPRKLQYGRFCGGCGVRLL